MIFQHLCPTDSHKCGGTFVVLPPMYFFSNIRVLIVKHSKFVFMGSILSFGKKKYLCY